MTRFGADSLALARNFLLAAVLLGTAGSARAAGECNLGFDAGGFLGMSTRAQSTGDGLSIEGELDAVAGAEWNDCLPVVPRLELAFGTSTVGPPWGDGVRAVEVKSLTWDTRVRAGATWLFYQGEHKALGVEALAGPLLRVRRVKTTITGRSSVDRDLSAHAEMGGGLLAQFGSWRLRLRAWGVLPSETEVTVGVGVGHQF